jgi:hypothetical protein
MKIIYVSGKYTDNNTVDVERNIACAEKAAIEIIHNWGNLGWFPFIPHKNTSHFELIKFNKLNNTYDYFLDGCLKILEKCDAIFMLNNWKASRGAKAEMDKAIEIGLPILFEEQGYREDIIKYYNK